MTARRRFLFEHLVAEFAKGMAALRPEKNVTETTVRFDGFAVGEPPPRPHKSSDDE